MLKKKLEEDMATNMKRLIVVLSELDSNPEDIPKRDAEEEQFFTTLKDIFNVFDEYGYGELQYPEYAEAWNFLGQAGNNDDIKRSFNNVDVDASGYVEWIEFAFSMMGEKALNYGAGADLALVNKLLDKIIPSIENLKSALFEATVSTEERAKNSATLRSRLQSVKGQISGEINALFSQLINMDPSQFMSEEEIDKHLEDAFNKFDEDGSGKLGKWQCNQAWLFLGLKGTDAKIGEACDGVDTDGSGVIDINEFKTVIKGERLVDWNVKNVLGKMGVQLNNMGGQYERFKATEQRRRLMKKEYEEKLATKTK